MAGDWMKVELATPDKPEIYQMAQILGMDPHEVFGRCFRVWSWFDEHTENGHAPSVTNVTLDSVARHAGFGEAMAEVGWIDVGGDHVTMPNFDRHNGKSAKKRALATERKRKARESNVTDKSRSERDGSVTREEKRRDKDKKTRADTRAFQILKERYGEKKGGSLAASLMKAHTGPRMLELVEKSEGMDDGYAWLRACCKLRLPDDPMLLFQVRRAVGLTGDMPTDRDEAQAEITAHIAGDKERTAAALAVMR